MKMDNQTQREYEPKGRMHLQFLYKALNSNFLLMLTILNESEKKVFKQAIVTVIIDILLIQFSIKKNNCLFF